MRKILVTGANGFIGSHLVRSLRNIRGADIEILRTDITDKVALNSPCTDAEMVFHLAAYVNASPVYDKRKEAFIYNVNVAGTRNLLEALGPSVRHVVFFSTVNVYGNKEGVFSEESEVAPETVYARTKLEAEWVIRDWGQHKGVKTTCLRLPPVYGPGGGGNIYKMIRAVNKGLFLMIGEGRNKRDLVNVGNVVDADMAAVDRQTSKDATYIVTDGEAYTLKEVYDLISRGLGKKPSAFYLPLKAARVLARMGDIVERIALNPMPFDTAILKKLTTSQVFLSEKIAQELGFKPKYNLYNSLKEALL